MTSRRSVIDRLIDRLIDECDTSSRSLADEVLQVKTPRRKVCVIHDIDHNDQTNYHQGNRQAVQIILQMIQET
jgi:hypothetical protein